MSQTNSPPDVVLIGRGACGVRRMAVAFGVFCAVVAALLLGVPHSVNAHEVPARVAVLAFVRAEGQVLRVVVRVPLEAMRDIEEPLYGDGTLDLDAMTALLPDAARLWLADYLTFYEDGTPLGGGVVRGARVSLPSERVFDTYESAYAHVLGAPLPPGTTATWGNALVDVVLEYPVESAMSRFLVEPKLAHLGVRTVTALHVELPGHGARVFSYEGNPGVIALDPRWHQAVWRFLQEGFTHILGGLDHLLFVFCLVIPVRRWRPLVAIVTAFTIAHSITLLAAARGVAPRALWFPPLVETLIAASIVYMALENILARPERLENRWRMAFAFGLVHGFGFSFALQDTLQFAGAHLVTSLAAFNVGVELGQLAVLAVALPVLHLARRSVSNTRALAAVLSALVAHSAWHWMTERGAELTAYRLGWPVVDAVFWLGVVRGAMLLLVAGVAAWLLAALYGRFLRGADGPGSTHGEFGAGADGVLRSPSS